MSDVQQNSQDRISSPDIIADATGTEVLKESSIQEDAENKGQESNSIDEHILEQTVDETEILIDENSELLETKYQVGNEGISAVGDNARVTINNYFQIVRESRLRNFRDEDKTSDEAFGGKDELIEQFLMYVRQSGTFPISSINKNENTQSELPENDMQISQWYYSLDEYEQCYVQAAAVLHGAPAQEVSNRADNLFSLHFDLKMQYNSSLMNDNTVHTFQYSTPSRNLQEKTNTITRRVDGVERLFWRDVDVYGISSFGLRLLDFLAGEFTNKGTQGQQLLEKLQEWSKESNQEASWRSVRALGVFLWHQSVGELRRIATLWVKNRSIRSWRRTAALLDSAYEIESIKYPETVDSAKLSSVLRLLGEWVSQSQKMKFATDTYMGCGAANTYGLIGKRNPEIALNELDQLLRLPPYHSTPEADALSAAIISAYISLSWSGHLSKVLVHLAKIAEQSVLQLERPTRLSERYTYRKQCEMMINITLMTFFLITADSLSEASPAASEAYIQPLPNQPSFPDPLGRDVILTGLLAQNDDRWRTQITNLLCAAIIEGHNRSSAFAVIQQWGETVLKAREEQSDEAQKIIDSFKQFLISLGKNIHSWCLYLEQQTGRSLSSFIAYKNRLESWSKHGGKMSELSRYALSQLSC